MAVAAAVSEDGACAGWCHLLTKLHLYLVLANKSVFISAQLSTFQTEKLLGREFRCCFCLSHRSGLAPAGSQDNSGKKAWQRLLQAPQAALRAPAKSWFGSCSCPLCPSALVQMLQAEALGALSGSVSLGLLPRGPPPSSLLSQSLEL